MILTFIILWLLAGAVGVWRAYFATMKEWWTLNHESYWDFHKRQGHSALQLLVILSPILMLAGPVTLILFEYNLGVDPKNKTWWFKIPKK